MLIPVLMKGVVKSTTLSRSAVVVKSTIAMSAVWRSEAFSSNHSIGSALGLSSEERSVLGTYMFHQIADQTVPNAVPLVRTVSTVGDEIEFRGEIGSHS